MSFNLNDSRIIGDTEEFKIFSQEFDQNIEFLESFSTLIWMSGRIISFFSDKKMHFVSTTLLDNSIQTLKSIKLCCSIGSFADANTLIRKLRDDLILYIYILDVTNKRKPFVEDELSKLNVNSPEELTDTFLNLRFNSELTEDEKAVDAWLNNTVLELPYKIKMKLSFENYMKFLKLYKLFEEMLESLKIDEDWETVYKSMLEERFDENQTNKLTMITSLQREQENLHKRLEMAEDHLFEKQIDVSTFNTMKQRIDLRMMEIKDELKSLQKKDSFFEKHLREGISFLGGVDRVYKSGTTDVKRKIIKTIFCDKLTYHNHYFATPKLEETIAMIMFRNKRVRELRVDVEKNASAVAVREIA